MWRNAEGRPRRARRASYAHHVVCIPLHFLWIESRDSLPRRSARFLAFRRAVVCCACILLLCVRRWSTSFVSRTSFVLYSVVSLSLSFSSSSSAYASTWWWCWRSCWRTRTLCMRGCRAVLSAEVCPSATLLAVFLFVYMFLYSPFVWLGRRSYSTRNGHANTHVSCAVLLPPSSPTGTMPFTVFACLVFDYGCCLYVAWIGLRVPGKVGWVLIPRRALSFVFSRAFHRGGGSGRCPLSCVLCFVVARAPPSLYFARLLTRSFSAPCAAGGNTSTCGPVLWPAAAGCAACDGSCCGGGGGGNKSSDTTEGAEHIAAAFPLEYEAHDRRVSLLPRVHAGCGAHVFASSLRCTSQGRFLLFLIRARHTRLLFDVATSTCAHLHRVFFPAFLSAGARLRAHVREGARELLRVTCSYPPSLCSTPPSE